MEPAKYYYVANYAIANVVQLDYLKRLFAHRRQVHFIEQINEVLNQGLENQPLVEREQLTTYNFLYPETLPSFKVTCIENIEVEETKNGEESIFCDKKISLMVKTTSEEKTFIFTVILYVKEGKYICVEKVHSQDSEEIVSYIVRTDFYQKELLRQIFNRKIELALTGNGFLYKLRDLPIISPPHYVEKNA